MPVQVIDKAHSRRYAASHINTAKGFVFCYKRPHDKICQVLIESLTIKDLRHLVNVLKDEVAFMEVTERTHQDHKVRHQMADLRRRKYEQLENEAEAVGEGVRGESAGGWTSV